jgi:hypothetical protein
MDSDASVEMVIKVGVDNHQVFYTTTMVCFDDNSTIRANCKWSFQDLKASKFIV